MTTAATNGHTPSGRDLFESRARELLAAELVPFDPYLADPHVETILVGADGIIKLKQAGSRYPSATSVEIPAVARHTIISLVATTNGMVCNDDAPCLETSLPGGERFAAVIPPVSPAPLFTIRKPSPDVQTLISYTESGAMTPEMYLVIHEAVYAQKGIVVIGETGSGKTMPLVVAMRDIIV